MAQLLREFAVCSATVVQQNRRERITAYNEQKRNMAARGMPDGERTRPDIYETRWGEWARKSELRKVKLRCKA